MSLTSLNATLAQAANHDWALCMHSILLWDHALSPGIRWLLKVSLHSHASAPYIDLTHTMLCTFFGVLWLLPVYMVSFPLSCVW